MRILPWIACGILAAGVLISREALAQSCFALADIEARAAGDGAFIAHDFRGDDAAAWLAAYDATPPVSVTPGDQVVVTEHPRRPTLYVYVLTEGCATGSGELTRMFVFRLNAAALGGGGDS